VSDFFVFPEPEPEPERPRRPPQPPWIAPPRGYVPGGVALRLVLARNDRVAVALTKLAAYPVGFEFELVVLTADEEEYGLDPMLGGRVRHPGMPRADPEQSMLRFGIEFADGRRVTNLEGRFPCRDDEPPTEPVLRPGGGSSSGGSEWRQDMWIWPLPPAGPLTFVCEWPAAGIPFTKTEIDAQPLLDAAGQAQQIFERSADADSSRRSSVIRVQSKRASAPPDGGGG
jgi:hypothetical protein